MANIRQTDLLEYITKKFNTNSFGIKFRMGTYGLDEDEGLVIYAPQRDNDGKFDVIESYDNETYQTSENAFVVMSGAMGGGEYTALPNVQLVTYDVAVEFLVYIDNPISEIIRMAIEEVRDSFIGQFEVMEINEVDLTDDDIEAPLLTSHVKLATTADSINFGDVITLKGRRYLNYSLSVTMTVSKNVEMGNQFEWYVGKYVNGSVTRTRMIPLIANFATSQDHESFQNLRSLNPLIAERAREVHNYVKSRGFAMTLTFLLDVEDAMNLDLFAECFEELETPNQYSIEMKFKKINSIGALEYLSRIAFTRKMIIGDAVPGDIVLGDPVVFSVGFVKSAK